MNPVHVCNRGRIINISTTLRTPQLEAFVCSGSNLWTWVMNINSSLDLPKRVHR